MNNSLFLFIFNVAIVVFVMIDLLLFPKTENTNEKIKHDIFMTIFWIFLGLSFSVFIYFEMGIDHFYEYLSAYFIEKSLSVDNIFVFLMIFQSLGIKGEYQRTLLFAGIWGALILRALMIFAISEILSAFHPMIYIFGFFILFIGVSSFFEKNNIKTDLNTKNNFWNKINLAKYFNVFQGNHNGKFFVKENGNWKITTLVVGIIYIEICDIIFAFDSIPALFSVTNNKLIIYTSNAFAIIGLRSLYGAFAFAVDKFYHLKYGVGLILSYVGMKMIFTDYITISPLTSLLIIAGILLASFFAPRIDFHLINPKSNKNNEHNERKE